jgi:hypothetical protein
MLQVHTRIIFTLQGVIYTHLRYRRQFPLLMPGAGISSLPYLNAWVDKFRAVVIFNMANWSALMFEGKLRWNSPVPSRVAVWMRSQQSHSQTRHCKRFGALFPFFYALFVCLLFLSLSLCPSDRPSLYICAYLSMYMSILSRVIMWLWTGIGLVIGFIEHFNTQLVTTLYRSLPHTD